MSYLHIYQFTFRIIFGISDQSEHKLILGGSAATNSHFALARSVETGIGVVFELVDVCEGWHSASASEFGASDQAIIGYS